MSIETYLVVPVENPARAHRLLSDGGDSVTHVGADFVVLYKDHSFSEVERSPETWGPIYVKELPPSLRRRLDPRGLLAMPEAGQAFESKTYSEVAESAELSVWLPARPVRRRRVKRVLLVALSSEREALLMQTPELVPELVSNRTTVAIPGSMELDERWLGLQRLLLDCLWLERIDDARADALAPRDGLLLYEDDTIDAARLVRADRAHATAAWLSTVTAEVIERACKAPPSPASRRFPESLGAAPADDREPSRRTARQSSRKTMSPALVEELRRLRAFYEDVLRHGRAVLAVRFRE